MDSPVSSRLSRKTLVVGFILLLVSASLLATGCKAPVAKKNAETLIFVDLSGSLSDGERRRIPDIVNEVSEGEPGGTRITVYVLDSDVDVDQPLEDIQIPDRSDMSNGAITSSQNQMDQAEMDLSNKITTLLDQRRQNKKLPAFTSCYLSSFSYVGDYFRTHPDVAVRHAIWVGDLIEMCKKVPSLVRFNLEQYRPTADYQAAVASYVKDLHMDGTSLSSVQLTAVLVPRSPAEGDNPVPSQVIKSYWRAVESKIGLSPDQLVFRVPKDYQHPM